MKDFKYYSDIKSPHYKRSDFYTTTWLTGGTVFAKQIGKGKIYYSDGNEYPLDEICVLRAMKKVVEKDTAAFEAASKPHRDKAEALFLEFKKDLYENLGIEDNPKKEKLFLKAWEHKSDEGFEKVYDYACSLVDLIE